MLKHILVDYFEAKFALFGVIFTKLLVC